MFKIVGESFVSREEVYKNVSLAALSSFKTVDAHYTCTMGKRQMIWPWMLVEVFPILSMLVMES